MKGVSRRQSPARRLSTAALALACVLAALVGSTVATRAFAPSVRPFALGTVTVSAEPAPAGRVDVYVPIADWGVRARPYRAPVAIKLDIRSLDREAALAALRSGREVESSLALVRSQLDEIVRAGLVRAALIALAGGALGGLFAGAIATALGRRRRWLPLGALAGTVTVLGLCAVAAVDFRRIEGDPFREATFYARGGELPRLLAFSEQLRTAGKDYTDSYEQALDGVTNLVGAVSLQRPRPATETSWIVASDLHSNRFVLPAFADYAAGKTAFLVGDFTELGTGLEQDVASRVAGLGDRIVAVSGNHDSRAFMRALARDGVTVLTRTGRLRPDGTTDGRAVRTIDGLRVAGFDDPLEGGTDYVHHRLELDGRRPGAIAAFLDWFAALPVRPQVVLVHQHGLAHALLRRLGEWGGPRVVILTGHDHLQHVERNGAHVLVDGGTLGAGGPFAIGEQSAGFIQLHFAAGGELDAADLIEVEPLSGAASARRIVFPPARAAGAVEASS